MKFEFNNNEAQFIIQKWRVNNYVKEKFSGK